MFYLFMSTQSLAEVEESKRALVAACAKRDSEARHRIDSLERDAAQRHAQYATVASGWATREKSIVESWEGERAAFEAERVTSATREERVLRELEAQHSARGAALPAAVAAFHAKVSAALAALAARGAQRGAARIDRVAVARRELAASDLAAADALAALRVLREDLVDDERDAAAPGGGGGGVAVARARKVRHAEALHREVGVLRAAASERDGEVESVRRASAAKQQALWESLTALLAESERAARRHAEQLAAARAEAKAAAAQRATFAARAQRAEAALEDAAAAQRARSVDHLARLATLHGLAPTLSTVRCEPMLPLHFCMRALLTIGLALPLACYLTVQKNILPDDATARVARLRAEVRSLYYVQLTRCANSAHNLTRSP